MFKILITTTAMAHNVSVGVTITIVEFDSQKAATQAIKAIACQPLNYNFAQVAIALF